MSQSLYRQGLVFTRRAKFDEMLKAEVSIPLSAGLGFHQYAGRNDAHAPEVSIPLSAGLGFHLCYRLRIERMPDASQSLYRQGLVFTLLPQPDDSQGV